MNFKIGCDPELFVTRDVALGEDWVFVSAHTLIPGTKSEPHKVRKGAVQVDGVAAEFNINPAENEEEFVGNIESVVEDLYSFLPKWHGLEIIPTAHFDPEYFNSLPDLVKMLGCQPDFNAYTGKENIPPETDEPFRTGSGHIHIGWTEFEDISNEDSHFWNCCDLTKQLDQALYFPSLSWDKDDKRRSLYGKIGAFRPKHYGLEYRCLSNAWLGDDNLIRFVYRRTVWATELFFKGVKLYEDAPQVPERYL